MRRLTEACFRKISTIIVFILNSYYTTIIRDWYNKIIYISSIAKGWHLYNIMCLYIYTCGIWLRHVHTAVYVYEHQPLFILVMWCMGCTSFWVYYISSCCSEIIIVPGNEMGKVQSATLCMSYIICCSLDFPIFLTLVAFVEHLASIACVAPHIYTQRKYSYYMEAILCTEQLN